MLKFYRSTLTVEGMAQPASTKPVAGPGAAPVKPAPPLQGAAKAGGLKLMPGKSDENSTVYNINERRITFNEVAGPAGAPAPSGSLKCNCWPVETDAAPGKGAASHGHGHGPHGHGHGPHGHGHGPHGHGPREVRAPSPSHNIAAHKHHARDPKTGLMTDRGPRGASTYQLASAYR